MDRLLPIYSRILTGAYHRTLRFCLTPASEQAHSWRATYCLSSRLHRALYIKLSLVFTHYLDVVSSSVWFSVSPLFAPIRRRCFLSVILSLSQVVLLSARKRLLWLWLIFKGLWIFFFCALLRTARHSLSSATEKKWMAEAKLREREEC